MPKSFWQLVAAGGARVSFPQGCSPGEPVLQLCPQRPVEQAASMGLKAELRKLGGGHGGVDEQEIAREEQRDGFDQNTLYACIRCSDKTETFQKVKPNKYT